MRSRAASSCEVVKGTNTGADVAGFGAAHASARMTTTAASAMSERNEEPDMRTSGETEEADYLRASRMPLRSMIVF